MYYGAIKNIDIANGPGIRVSLFVSGCRNHCKGCFQPETWDFNYGKEFGMVEEAQILSAMKAEYVQGLTILGGEPFEPENQEVILPLLKKVKEMYPNKDIWIFSGYRLDDELLKDGVHPHLDITRDILSLVDVLVDGRFIEAKRNLSLVFRGSENQRLIDMKKTLEEGQVVLWDEKQTRE